MDATALFASLREQVQQGVSALNLDNMREAQGGTAPAPDGAISADVDPLLASGTAAVQAVARGTAEHSSVEQHPPAPAAVASSLDELAEFESAPPVLQPSKSVFDALAVGGRMLEAGGSALATTVADVVTPPRPPTVPSLASASPAWASGVGVGAPSVLAGALAGAAAPLPDGSVRPDVLAAPPVVSPPWLSAAAAYVPSWAAPAPPPQPPAPPVFSGQAILPADTAAADTPPDSFLGGVVWVLTPLATWLATSAGAATASATAPGGCCDCAAARYALCLAQALVWATGMAVRAAWALLALLAACCLPAHFAAALAAARQRVVAAAWRVTLTQAAVGALLLTAVLLALFWLPASGEAAGEAAASTLPT